MQIVLHNNTTKFTLSKESNAEQLRGAYKDQYNISHEGRQGGKGK